MGSLSNLYISQSYQSLLHFGSNTGSVAQLGLIEDGLGNSLGLYLNNAGDLRTDTSISSSTIEATNLVIKNKIELTGSIDIDGPVTASTAFIEGDLIVSGTLFSSKVVTLIESSSIIYSSGSNILGDEVTDTQTLIGTVIISGSQSLTGSLQVSNDISASTINGLGNATDFSTSVDSRLDIVEATASLYVGFSQSVDNRLDELEATASYLNTTFSQSVDFRLDELENWSSSLQTNFATTAELTATASFLQSEINKKLDTGSFNAYTQSFSSSVATSFSASAASQTALSSSINGTINALSTSIQITDNAQTGRINELASFTGSYATTGSNSFNGNQTITGSLILSSSAAVELTTIGASVFSGSVAGVVIPLSVVANTASMDCSLGNFFTITLPTGSSTYINPINIRPGTTLSLRVTQPSVTGGAAGTVAFNTATTKFPQAFPYIATPITGAIDILSFQSYDTSSLFGVAVNTMI